MPSPVSALSRWRLVSKVGFEVGGVVYWVCPLLFCVVCGQFECVHARFGAVALHVLLVFLFFRLSGMPSLDPRALLCVLAGARGPM